MTALKISHRALFAVAVLAGGVTSPSAQATLGSFDQHNYVRCIADATADATNMPAGPGRDAVYEASRKACYQKFFLDRLDANH